MKTLKTGIGALSYDWVSVIFFKAVDSVKKRKGDTARDFLF
jgi:hypothetical protein